MDHQKLLPAVEKIVCQAGDILVSFFRSDHLKGTQKAFGDLVTQADLASEEFLINKLLQLAPNVRIYAEESGASGAGDYAWIIDPLDGTTNFAHGHTYFCISVALTFQDRPILACVYRPSEREMFTAIAGQGAQRNGKK